MNCRICSNDDLTKTLNLGLHPPSDGFLSEEQIQQPETYYPLELYYCDKCNLVQLGYVVPKEVLYNDDYPYTTGTNRVGVEHFRQFAKETVERFKLGKDDLVVDIGSNDGTLLQGFKNAGCEVLGIEPCKHLADMANQGGIFTLHKFFPSDVDGFYTDGPVKLITATNVFAHVDDLHDFTDRVAFLLADDGIFIIEAPYLLDMLDHLLYDQIYHEHLSYLSVTPLKVLFEKYNMEIFDVQNLDFHGGSLRYFVARNGQYPTSTNVKRFLEMEQREINLVKLENFAHRVRESREKLLWFLLSLKRAKKRVVGLCASAKGNTLLNYCGIDLDYIAEKSPLKVGRYSPGRHIRVVSDETMIRDAPDYALLLACNFSGSIIPILREKGFKGKFILPLPSPEIYDD